MGNLDINATAIDRRAMGDHFTPSVAMHFVRLLTDYCAAQDIEARVLLGQAGIETGLLDDPDARLPFADFCRLCDNAAQRLDDPFLGLHLGEAIKPGYFGPHGFALISCDTVGELLQRSRRFSILVFDACRNEYETHGEEIVRYWRSQLPDGAAVGRLQDELNMAAWITLSRWITGRSDINPTWLSFRHDAPAEPAEYQRIFGCPIQFAASDTAIAFEASYLGLQLPQANREVRHAMDAVCERMLQRLEHQRDPAWLEACRRTIIQAFEDGEPALARVAAHIGLPPRTLRHRLTQCGESFRSLVDKLRRELAQDYLADSSLSLVEVAFMLGYSDQSAFQRSFKRWTGYTPGEYRRR